MSTDTKSVGKFALVQRILDDKGNDTGVVRARITDDIVLTRGQTIFFNDFKEDIEKLVELKVITQQEGNDKIVKRESLDADFNQKTLYSLRAGKVPEVVATGDAASSASGNTL